MNYQNEDHLDLRQKKTRRLLVEALAQLLTERPFQELSVVDICRRAMVHRTTFYAHFNDKQELLHYLLEGLEQECVATCLPQDPDRSPPGISVDSCPKLSFSSLLSTGLCTGPASTAAPTPAFKLWKRVLPGNSAVCFPNPAFGQSPRRSDPEVAARFYAGAMLSLIRSVALQPSPRCQPVTFWLIWSNSFPFSEAQLCRKNAPKVP